MILDLEKASKALAGLKSEAGKAALDELYKTLEHGFRKQLGVDLNDAEFRYVMQTLFNEQVVTVDPNSPAAKAPATHVVHGFSIRGVI